ncbi:preprotein translocase subunit SecD [Pseudonocardia hierapolitana]|uniref:Protein translocase subunit SecD n=1 Tax=Pseudonocardia hierapolitana TaxID=1128676 RepID=A0A561T1E7_9PSEU|nr:protein translocase subunit SecD [Pseudonocardia hierapolitana]TWF80930.1 preprotein translocase subunit SecD [Pseudonocardia hierapolitana]
MASTPGQIRPWRHLAAFVAIVAALYALVFFTGDGNPRPKLGIDLQGGTRVTLQPRTETGAEPPREQLLQAQQIIEQRVNGLGVGGAEVVVDGSNLTITVPGQEGDQARSLGQTAQLRFREVVGGPYAAQQQPQQQPQPGAPQPGAPPADPAAPPVDAGQAPPTGQPQGMGDAVERDVAPVAFSRPLQDPVPPPAPPPAPGPAAPADPRLAAEVDSARQMRQSSDPTVQETALLTLDCNARDPLRGYDDPTKPLVACNQDGTEKYILGPSFLEGTEIASAQAQANTTGVGWVVSLTFESLGAQTWGEYTTNNVGKLVAFTLDGEVVSAPRINQPIFGPTQIEGQFNQADAEQLAGVLRYGSLPLSFESSEAQTVSATLGLASLEAGMIAGAIGLALVFLYGLFYYRVLGILLILSLALSAAIVYPVLVLLGRWIGLTLDLAGVAGFILAIGITADSFIIFFERLKDEMRDGRTFRSAVPRGWVRARRTILSADAVSFLCSAVLYLLAIGQVKGFAFTLGLSTVLDLIVVFLVTHPLVALAAKSRVFSNPGLSGLGEAARTGAERRRVLAAASGRSKGA